MSEKKSFVLYFDMYPNICDLPADQRGELLSALFEYAETEVEYEDEDSQNNKDWTLAKHPHMDAGTRMAFSFIAEAIHRDTVKWREKHRRYQQGAEKRKEKSKVDDFLDYV